MVLPLLFFLCITFLNYTYSLTMPLSRFSLKQSINMPAMKMVTSIVRKPSLAIPKLELSKLDDLNLQSLKNIGVKYLVFDKDNTLTHTYCDELHSSVRDKIHECRQMFGSSSMAILSNSVGTLDDDNYEGASLTESRLGIKVIRHEQKKPGCLQEVLDHFQTRDNPQVFPNEICMIGDRVLTDIVFANMHNMHSVLVAPLSHTSDHPVAVVIRFLELYVLLPLLKLCGISRR